MKASKKILEKYLPKLIGFRLSSLYLVNPNKAMAKAYQLFSTPRKGKVKPEQEVFLNKAKSTAVEVQGQSIQTYHWKGDGKTVLLVHGWDSNTHRWESLIEDLKNEDYNIVAFDAPAHGFSEGKLLHVPLYSDCLDRMITLYKPKFLIGHSVGGMTLIFNQYKRKSSSVQKLVVLGAPSEMNHIMNDYQKILNLNAKFMNSLSNYFKEKFNYTFDEFSIANFAKSVKKQTLIIHDEYDKVAPIQAAKAIHKSMENSKLIITEGAGHSLYKEEIRTYILNFLKESQ